MSLLLGQREALPQTPRVFETQRRQGRGAGRINARVCRVSNLPKPAAAKPAAKAAGDDRQHIGAADVREGAAGEVRQALVTLKACLWHDRKAAGRATTAKG